MVLEATETDISGERLRAKVGAGPCLSTGRKRGGM